MLVSSTCGESPWVSLWGAGLCAEADGMLMAVTTGTTQPARSSARRVKSFCLSDVSDVSAFTSGTSSSRESAILCLRTQFNRER